MRWWDHQAAFIKASASHTWSCAVAGISISIQPSLPPWHATYTATNTSIHSTKGQFRLHFACGQNIPRKKKHFWVRCHWLTLKSKRSNHSLSVQVNLKVWSLPSVHWWDVNAVIARLQFIFVLNLSSQVILK